MEKEKEREKGVEMMSSPAVASPMSVSSHTSDPLTPSMSGSVSAWEQYKILMKKNWITTKRNRTVTIVQLFMPFCFVLLLYLLSTSIQNMSKASIEISKVTHPKEILVSGIPKFECEREIYGPCFSLAYSPNNVTVVQELVQKVAWDSGLTHDDMIGFSTAEEMDDYILQHPWSVQAGYIFMSWENGIWDYTIQFNDTTTKYISHLFEEYSAADIVIPMASMMDKQIIQYQQKLSNSSLPDLDYTFATLQFPQELDLRNDFMMYMFPVFFLAMMMLYFVTMARGLVLEKELKLKEGMRMMGLKEFPYWASWFTYYCIIVIIATLVAIICGHIFNLDVITDNDFGSIFFLLLLFGISMLTLAFLLASLQDKSSLTLTTGFIMWVISASVFATINEDVYSDGNSAIAANILSLYSPFCFSKGMFDLSRAAFENRGRSFSDRSNKDFSSLFWLEKVYYFLIIDTFIYLIVAFYVTMVFPGEFGVPKSFYFFLQPSYWTGKPSKHSAKRRTKFTPHKVVDDEDVMEEEKIVKEEKYPQDTVVVIEDLMKVYESGFLFCKKSFAAVKGLSISMQNNQLFCLLGPNGAGKSTTFNMLSGIFPSSAGDAVLFGHSIVDEMDEIRKIMGVCAQHDLLWDELTGKEHLEFFCRFKGVPKDQVEREVVHRLELVGLTDVGNVPTAVYSGGEKRRLSVALATVGDPKIIFLDEPTTGMDPVSRQQVWKVISEAKKGRVVILTTHSMEEADVLSDRIAIVAHGQLRCIGSNIHLKNKFGSGYQLTLVFPPANSSQVLQNISTFVKQHLPKWEDLFTKAHTTPQSLYITIPYKEADYVPDLLQTLENNSADLGIEEITMNLSSLEEVFIRIATESQKETSVSLEEIEASSQELMQLAEATKKTTGRKTNFKRQTNALIRKHAAFYKRSWTTLLVQFLIPVIFILALFGTSSPETFNFIDDPHPLILPPQVPYQPSDPVRFSIPYVFSSSSSSSSLSSLGSCCQTKDGFLGFISFSVLNSSIRPADASFPYSLGDYSDSDYSFEKFSSNDEMFSMLYDTTKTGWIIAYLFETMDFTNNRFHIGYMKNISEWGARGSLAGVNLIDNALLSFTTSPSHSLSIRLKKFPSWEHKLQITGSGAAGTWVLLGCSFFMVPILSLIVREKQDRLRNLLVLAGMRMFSYWIVLFCLGLIAYFIVMLFWMALGYALQQVAFTHVAPGALILLFFVYAFCQVGFAFFTSTLVDDEPTAALGGYTWILFFVILTQSIVAIIVDLGSDSEMYGVSVLPPFAVTVVVNAMSTYYFPSGGSMSMSEFADDRASMALLILFLVGLGFFIIHSYLDQVYPSRYGISKHPLFFIPKYAKARPPEIRIPEWCPKKIKNSVSQTQIDIHTDPRDVADMRKSAVGEYHSPHPNFPLIIPGISKSFIGNGVVKVAVDDLPLLVSQLECFGLLGPNGGGKTTLVNILSGLYPTSSGDAKIKGHSVVEDLAKAQRHMGVCPQDCILWKELSAREHLLLFGRLRNLRGQELETAVNLTLKQVLLTDAADRPCGGYSGGMKRRLSLAISLIGCPPVVLLDEPTTGVDPFSRHVVWDTIRAYKHYCTIILITHNMEEADALCERVGMMSEGRMACVGRPSELKVRYNVGYSLTILHSAVNPDNIIALVESIVEGAQLLDTLPGSCLFTLPKANTRLSILFSAFKEQSDSLQISDWAVLPSNLEDVLIKSTHKEM